MKTACVYSVIGIWSVCVIIFKGNFSFSPESTTNYLMGASPPPSTTRPCHEHANGFC